MNAAEFQEVCKFIRTWWPTGNTQWSGEQAADLFHEFQPIPLDGARSALVELRNTHMANAAPSPARVMKSMHEWMAHHGDGVLTAAEYCARHGHTYGILRFEEGHGDGRWDWPMADEKDGRVPEHARHKRYAVCSVCGMAGYFDPKRLRTVSELAENEDVPVGESGSDVF